MNACRAPKFIDSSPTANVLARAGSLPDTSCRDDVASGAAARDPEDVDGNLSVLQELLRGLQLLGVAVDVRERSVRGGESMRADHAVLGGRIVRWHERHVAVGALLRLGGVVERSGALAGDAGRLPVVVVVEAAEPPVRVHRHVQVNLVTRRAELRGLFPMERLDERVAVRLRVELDELVVHGAKETVLARRQIVQRRVLDDEVPLAHRALHARDRVARGARESGLRLRRVDLLLDRAVEPAVEEHRVIVAAGAPLRRLRADDVLHVLDRLAVPLIVERREVMRRGVPLVVDVLVASAARGARHEKVGRDDAADVRFRR